MAWFWPWFLWPVKFADSHVLRDEFEVHGANWAHALALSVASFLFWGIGLLLLAILVYTILLWVDRAAERLLRWSCLGTPMSTVRRTAHRYAEVSALLRNLRSRVPITHGYGESHEADHLPMGRSIATRIGQWTIRLLASVPYLVRTVTRETIHLLRSPFFVYCLVASIVHVMGTPTHSLRAIVHDAWHWGGNPDSVAAFSLLAALLAVLLDHGLSARIRARNAWRRSTGERAEAALADMAQAAASLATAIGSCTDRLVQLIPTYLEDAVESGTQDLVTACDGKVKRVIPPLPSDRTRYSPRPSRRDWALDTPLLHETDHWSTRTWEPDSDVGAALAKLKGIVAEHKTDPLISQAPGSARYFSVLARYSWLDLEVSALGRRNWESLGKKLHSEGTVIIRRAERSVERWDADHAAHKGGLHGPEVPPQFTSLPRLSAHLDVRACQQALDSATRRCHDAIWSATVVGVDASRFSARISNWHTPQGVFARVASRFGD